jgi:hypothetical protein
MNIWVTAVAEAQAVEEPELLVVEVYGFWPKTA